ncbi:hypothetical protein amrb99_21530 [Actinomadura sp. RB99]|nr:hypothetical protein [Actinomadura sp. RB99]
MSIEYALTARYARRGITSEEYSERLAKLG